MLPDLLLFFMLAAAVALVMAPRLIHSLLALCVFSSLLALQYVFLRAPDVALTEAALGAGLSTLVYLTAIRKTSRTMESHKNAARMRQEPQEDASMMALHEYITPETTHLLKGRKRDPVVQELLQICLHDKPPAFVEHVVHAVLVSKRSASPMDMNLGKGFALVHARHDECTEMRFTIGLLPEPTRIYRGEKVHTLIGMVLPSSESRHYLAFLARFGRLMQAPETSARFEEAGRRMAAGSDEEARTRLTEYVRAFEEA